MEVQYIKHKIHQLNIVYDSYSMKLYEACYELLEELLSNKWHNNRYFIHSSRCCASTICPFNKLIEVNRPYWLIFASPGQSRKESPKIFFEMNYFFMENMNHLIWFIPRYFGIWKFNLRVWSEAQTIAHNLVLHSDYVT